MEPAKNEDADKDAAIARRRKLSLPPPTVKLIEESDLLQQSLYQGGGGVGASRQDQHEPRLQGAGGIRSPVKSKAYPAYNRCTVQTGDADETGSTYSSAYSSKSDSVTPVDSFSELSDGSLDERTSRQTSQISPGASSSSSPAHCTQQQSDPELVPKKVKAWSQALGGWTFNGVAPYPLSPQLKDEAKRSPEVRIPVTSPDVQENLPAKSESNFSPTSRVDEKETPLPLQPKHSYPLGKFVKNSPTTPTEKATAPKANDTRPVKVATNPDKLTNPWCTGQDKKQLAAKATASPSATANPNPPTPTAKNGGTTAKVNDTLPAKVAAKTEKRPYTEQEKTQSDMSTTTPTALANTNPPTPTAKSGRTTNLQPAKAAKIAAHPDNLPCIELAKDMKQPASPLAPAEPNPRADPGQPPRSLVCQESFFNKSSAWTAARKKSEELIKARQTGASDPQPPACNSIPEEPTDLEQRAKAFGGVRRPATVRRTQSMFVKPTSGGQQKSEAQS
ncbi:hypothetical protein EMCRGX_G023634 [Ephydatia muelleri]|eukprot:Em0017g97a